VTTNGMMRQSFRQFQTVQLKGFRNRGGELLSLVIARRDYNPVLMAGFDDAWAVVAGAHGVETVSPELKPLVRQVYDDIVSKPVDLAALKRSIEALLEYLAAAGRTNANCWAVDLFFAVSEGWERDWTEQELPDDFHDVLALMGEALHDAVQAPTIAENAGCLPEQLLERVRRLSV
jgi:hypothetical protein